MTTDNFCFYLQNRLMQTTQTGGQWYSDTPLLVKGLSPSADTEGWGGLQKAHQPIFEPTLVAKLKVF
jgi:hypothetical protein